VVNEGGFLETDVRFTEAECGDVQHECRECGVRPILNSIDRAGRVVAR
jgi:hypothetical protein